jgi:hypothetical protein
VLGRLDIEHGIAGQRLCQLGGDGNLRRQRDAGQVVRIEAAGGDRRRRLGPARPQGGGEAGTRRLHRQGGAPGACAGNAE